MTNVKSLPPQPEEERRAGVTFTYADCNNRVLHDALEKLDNYTGFSGPDFSRFNKIKNAYDAKSKEVSRLFKKLIAKHAEHEPAFRKEPKTNEMVPILKPSGKPLLKPTMVPSGRGRMDFLFKSRVAFNRDYQELMAETFEVKAFALLTDDLRKAGLTPKEVRACAKLLSDADPDLIVETPVYDPDEQEEDDDDETDEDEEDIAPEASRIDSDAAKTEEGTFATPSPRPEPGSHLAAPGSP